MGIIYIQDFRDFVDADETDLKTNIDGCMTHLLGGRIRRAGLNDVPWDGASSFTDVPAWAGRSGSVRMFSKVYQDYFDFNSRNPGNVPSIIRLTNSPKQKLAVRMIIGGPEYFQDGFTGIPASIMLTGDVMTPTGPNMHNFNLESTSFLGVGFRYRQGRISIMSRIAWINPANPNNTPTVVEEESQSLTVRHGHPFSVDLIIDYSGEVAIAKMDINGAVIELEFGNIPPFAGRTAHMDQAVHSLTVWSDNLQRMSFGQIVAYEPDETTQFPIRPIAIDRLQPVSGPNFDGMGSFPHVDEESSLVLAPGTSAEWGLEQVPSGGDILAVGVHSRARASGGISPPVIDAQIIDDGGDDIVADTRVLPPALPPRIMNNVAPASPGTRQRLNGARLKITARSEN